VTDELENDAFIAAARRALDRRVEALDGATLSRLNQARHLALAKKTGMRRWGFSIGWVPVGSFAAGLTAIVVWLGGASGTVPQVVNLEPAASGSVELTVSRDAGELSGAGDELELIPLEELEFVGWLLEVEEPHAG